MGLFKYLIKQKQCEKSIVIWRLVKVIINIKLQCITWTLNYNVPISQSRLLSTIQWRSVCTTTYVYSCTGDFDKHYVTNGFEQYSQWYFNPSCALMWSLKCVVALNPFLQSSQWYLYCPVWICLCCFRLLFVGYSLPQMSQANLQLCPCFSDAFSDLITLENNVAPLQKYKVTHL